MPIKIICPGKTRETWIKQGIEEYQKRLNPVWKIDWQELKDASLKSENTIVKVKKQEALIINKTISTDDYIIALDERGKNLDSISFAHTLEELVMTKSIVFVIGGVYGLDSSVLNRANLTLSFSSFTFPHQLIRLILMEQLYRAWTIISGKTYHY